MTSLIYSQPRARIPILRGEVKERCAHVVEIVLAPILSRRTICSPTSFRGPPSKLPVVDESSPASQEVLATIKKLVEKELSNYTYTYPIVPAVRLSV
jgi:hypothetical protein